MTNARATTKQPPEPSMLTMTNATHSPGKQPLLERQLSAIFNSLESSSEVWKKPTPAADMSLLCASIDSIASNVSNAELWKSKDIANLFASGESTAKMATLSSSTTEAFRSIDAAVGLMSVPNMADRTVSQTLKACSLFTSKESQAFASVDPLSVKSADAVPVSADTKPGIYESREWLELYKETHMEIEYSGDLFKTNDSTTVSAPKTSVSKWEDKYGKALDVPPLELSSVDVLTPKPIKPKPKKNVKAKSSKRGEPKEKIFVEPNRLDIISGRGGKSNSWPGNERYRAAIEEAKPAYRDGEKYQKTIMSQQVVEKMMDEGRRFLKLEERAGPRRGEYYLMTKNQARKKCGQALREENTPESRKKKREFYANKN